MRHRVHHGLVVMGHSYGAGYLGFPVAGILMMCVMCIAFGTFQAYLTLRGGSCLPAALNGFETAGLIFSTPTCVVGTTALIVVAAWMAPRLVRMQRAGEGLLLTASNDGKDQQAFAPVPSVGARP